MIIASFIPQFLPGKNGKNNSSRKDNKHPIDLHQVTKVYQTAAGGYQALKEIDLSFNQGEFVGIIGKSGSGKSTLINMITGIDHPTNGEVWVNGTPIHQLSENQMARWRGKNLGIVFQFFQLLPTLSVLDNVMLPMDFCNIYPAPERKKHALALLELVDMVEHAEKLPSALSGGQQQRVAIARALANDPPILIADEPTGNLDSKTADNMFQLFERLTREGKTVVMVTHDSSLARRVSRTVLIADGEVVNEYVARALPSLPPQVLLNVSHKVKPVHFPGGSFVMRQGEPGEKFYIIQQGTVEVLLSRPFANDLVAQRIVCGQYFGEISLYKNTRTAASVRAVPDGPVDLLALDKQAFDGLLNESPEFRALIETVVSTRTNNNGTSMGVAVGERQVSK